MGRTIDLPHEDGHLVAALAAVLGQLAVELGAGQVPVPPEVAWLVPIVNAGLVTLVAYVPSPVSRRNASWRPESP